MEEREQVPCAVWNADDDVWVLPSANDLKPASLPTIAEVVDKFGSPIMFRYPGSVETVEAVH